MNNNNNGNNNGNGNDNDDNNNNVGGGGGGGGGDDGLMGLLRHLAAEHELPEPNIVPLEEEEEEEEEGGVRVIQRRRQRDQHYRRVRGMAARAERDQPLPLAARPAARRRRVPGLRERAAAGRAIQWQFIPRQNPRAPGRGLGGGGGGGEGGAEDQDEVLNYLLCPEHAAPLRAQMYEFKYTGRYSLATVALDRMVQLEGRIQHAYRDDEEIENAKTFVRSLGIVKHKYLDERCPDRPLREFRDILDYEDDIIRLLREDYQIRVTRKFEDPPSYPNEERRDRDHRGMKLLSLEIECITVDDDDQHPSSWDLPEEIGIFDKAVSLSIGPGCRSLPETIKYMTMLDKVVMTECAADGLTVPRGTLGDMAGIRGLHFNRCKVSVLSQFLELSNAPVVQLKNCTYDGYKIPEDHFWLAKNGGVILKLDESCEVLNAFANVEYIQEVAFCYDIASGTGEEGQQQYIDQMVGVLSTLRTDGDNDAGSLSPLRKGVGKVSLGFKKTTSLQYCDMFCEVIRTFPNVKDFGCRCDLPIFRHEMFRHTHQYPIVEPDCLGMLVDRILSIRADHDSSFAKSIKKFWVSAGLMQAANRLRNLIKLFEVFPYQPVIDFGDLMRWSSNLTFSQVISPHIRTAMSTDEYRRLETKLHVILNRPKFRPPVDNNNSKKYMGVESDKKRKERNKKQPPVPLPVWPLVVTRFDNLSTFRSFNVDDGFDIMRNQQDLGPNRTCEIQRSLVFYLLRQGLSTNEDWLERVSSSNISQKNSNINSNDINSSAAASEHDHDNDNNNIDGDDDETKPPAKKRQRSNCCC